MTEPRTRMTVDNVDSDRLAVELEFTFSSGDTMAFNFKPQMKAGESLRQLQDRVLSEAQLRIQQILDLE